MVFTSFKKINFLHNLTIKNYFIFKETMSIKKLKLESISELLTTTILENKMLI